MASTDSSENQHRQTAAHAPAPKQELPIDPAELESIAATRESLTEPGEYLVFVEADALRVVVLSGDWTRIGRSTAADVRFDDPTVSRRHALIVREPDGMKLLDDRSLNGVFVDGERIERHGLSDGESFLIGRYRINFVSVAVQAATASDTPPDALRV